ncbi:MAG: tol-pal system-associated acyl-CoA thioesterase [Alphaproteobacteria bacterium]|jgi:acyl-CoA thioester hydrolase|nr:tol-pal system-associated acyl-CoA thioesterase [Alphaproteobacteria bacterium]MBT5389220.1 tol-pal system-associated acyl-CoA thioesterase [Alphaproteobacteria bacterium]MBT5540684.1 tol-pal system-associated acyl-CoA thioesterase [Alphaproteobacteria bacterium]MBT5653908.1 tol-pal system-associated acyl-CoA thioesterase [Alphaproteobacteria bacterium]
MPAEQFSPHRFPVRIYFEDTDAGGIVYHGSYLRFAERARTEFLRALGFEQSSLMKEQQCVIVLRSCNIDFLKPAHLDDLLEIHTTVDEIKNASLMMDQQIYRDQTLLTQLSVRLVFITTDGHPIRIPENILTLFKQPLKRG